MAMNDHRGVEEYGFGNDTMTPGEEHQRAQETGEVFEGYRWSGR